MRLKPVIRWAAAAGAAGARGFEVSVRSAEPGGIRAQSMGSPSPRTRAKTELSGRQMPAPAKVILVKRPRMARVAFTSGLVNGGESTTSSSTNSSSQQAPVPYVESADADAFGRCSALRQMLPLYNWPATSGSSRRLKWRRRHDASRPLNTVNLNDRHGHTVQRHKTMQAINDAPSTPRLSSRDTAATTHNSLSVFVFEASRWPVELVGFIVLAGR